MWLVAYVLIIVGAGAETRRSGHLFNCHHSSTLRTHGCARSVDTFVQIKSSFSMDFPPCWCANKHSSDSRLAIKSSLLNHTSRASSSSGLIPKKINRSQSLSREMWLIINESFLTPPFLLRVARENLILSQDTINHTIMSCRGCSSTFHKTFFALHIV